MNRRTLRIMILNLLILMLLSNCFILKVEAAETGSTETSAKDLLSITYKLGFEILYDDDSESIALVITNLSNAAVKIDTLTFTNLNGNYLKVYDEKNNELESGKKNQLSEFEIAAKQTKLLLLKIKTEKRITTGNNFLIFDVGYSQSIKDISFDYNAVVPIDFKTEVTATGDIFNLLSLPSFLFLPGFIFTVILIYILKLEQIKFATAIEFKSPIFWVISIIISMTFAKIYEVKQVNIFRTYGLSDIIKLGLIAVVLSISMSFISVLIHKDYLYNRKIVANDNEISVIRKVYRIQRRLRLKRVTFDGSDKNKLWLLLNEDAEKAYICEQIKISLNQKNNTLTSDVIDYELNNRIVRGMNKQLIRYLDWNKKSLMFHWSSVKICPVKNLKQEENEYSLIIYR